MIEAPVKTHVSRILGKLDMTNRVQIAISPTRPAYWPGRDPAAWVSWCSPGSADWPWRRRRLEVMEQGACERSDRDGPLAGCSR